MRCSRWLWVAVGVVLSANHLDAAPGAGKPIVTNKLRFRIPFRFDAAALQRMNARELHLYASTNRGASWGVAQSMAPQAGRFEYQATTDGEYWFAVRTIDGFGQAHPGGDQLEPGLIVVVDTAPPQLELQIQPSGAGKVQLSWQAQDPHLDPATLRLEYLQPGSSEWQPVSVLPRGSGQTSWSVPQGGQVAVRGSIADLAGNQGLKQATTSVAGGNEPSPRPAGSSIREPIAGGDAHSIFPQEAQPNPFAGPIITPGQINRNPATASQPATLAQPQFISGQPAERPEITQERWQTGETAASDATTAYRPASRQRIVNTKRFLLGYKVDDVGPSGVGGVDLFITQDNGRKWYRYGEDSDRASPMEVEVPQDGEYGFAVRVRSGAGLGTDPPTSGEPPAIFIVVDQTAPLLELLPVQQGQGAAMNQIQLRWRLSDAYPTDKSISLYYGPTLQGPWELISGWRQDTGSFVWTVGTGAPSQFYVRVMGRDAAGNIAKAETPTPIIVDLSRPSARIVDVEIQPLPQ